MNEIKTSPIITQELLNHFVEFEGKINHFYLDGPGFVTIGIGCVIVDSTSSSRLHLINKKTNLSATISEKIDEYRLIKQCLPGKTAVYYEQFTKLYLSDNDIVSLFEFRISNLLSMLRSILPEFQNLPDDAQDVLTDMAFNLGVTGLSMKFPRFVESIRRKNWNQAILECHRAGIQESRNAWTKRKLSNCL